MTFPTRVTFHGVERTASVEAEIQERLRKLERLSRKILDCRVSIEAPHVVHLTMHLPKMMLTVTKGENDPDLHVSVRDAFHAVERALRERTPAKLRRVA